MARIVVNLARFVKRDVSRSLFWSVLFGGLLALPALFGDDPPELSASRWILLFVQFFIVVIALRFFYYLFLYRNFEANNSEQFRDKYDHFIADNKLKWW